MTEGVSEQDARENIWTYEIGSDRRLNELAYGKIDILCLKHF
jgi:hypothetical protein